jgi:uncharacterized DUF497 family protein
MLNLQLAKAYLAGTDAEMPKRTWQHALEVVIETKRGANKERWKRVAKDRALSLLWSKVIVETEAELIHPRSRNISARSSGSRERKSS